jgi:hypothetical protein
VTFANIQNISILARADSTAALVSPICASTLRAVLVRLATSSRRSAAGARSHGFAGIDNAPQVRELIQSRLRQWKDAGLGDHDDHAAEMPASGGAALLAALREVRAAATALRESGRRSGLKCLIRP